MDDDTSLPVAFPTICHYSFELAEKLCDLITDGKTVTKACESPGMPARRTIAKWLKQYPEFREIYHEAVWFRTQCLTDDAIDIADDAERDCKITKKNDDGEIVVMYRPEQIALTRMRLQARYEQIKQMQPKGANVRDWSGDGARLIGEQKAELDPVYGQILDWELEARKRREARVAAQAPEIRQLPSQP